ncbi:ABC transporter ATP-binding protein [Aneurinibacillus sp. Ricciae_BoGa-3]|uniref:ABC transporter ATP-binding protein n=1 Tax=Aneurinibacillus sp. Ricciae_BoGa-3 TaxID=3022697 RepID=UPI002340BB19|nr:ABC transporter ATP-binding protein [Aneurinibacillus sp. Ricciae_BoGa-3]WCK53479.1 ABC transporter ATP-binding protein [Aneurinibacillus sp. Ricciae_BoGa-3]
MKPLLAINNLKTHFFTSDGVVKSVDGVDLTVYRGETVGIVGESGCGKSVTALSVMRLIPNPPGKIVDGSIQFEDKDLVKVAEKRMRAIRGNEIAMIFQDPMSSLNPVYTVGMQIAETVRLHKGLGKKKALERAVELLRQVGIPRAEQIADEYPHRLSGGMRQRVMIAMAMACNPKLLIADEPTTALDVTIQAQILDLMLALKKEHGTAILMITHDLGVVAEMCDRVVVMYGGKVVEEADVSTLFERPSHPYTQGLLRSIPSLDQDKEWLDSIPGNVPIPSEMPQGCKFAPRCPHAMQRCVLEEPPLYQLAGGQKSRCFLAAEEVDHVGSPA